MPAQSTWWIKHTSLDSCWFCVYQQDAYLQEPWLGGGDLDQAGHITHLLLTPFMTCNFWSYFQPLTCYKGSPQQVDLHAWFGWFPFLMVPQRGIVSLAGAEPGTVHLLNEGANYYTTERLVCVWVILYFLHMFYTYVSLWLMDKCFAWAFPVSMNKGEWAC